MPGNLPIPKNINPLEATESEKREPSIRITWYILDEWTDERQRAIKLQLTEGDLTPEGFQGQVCPEVVCHSLPLCSNHGVPWWSPFQMLSRTDLA